MSFRLANFVATAVAGLAALTAMPARAGDEGPVIVIPSRPGIPVVINGLDASYAVVEGDWGLARPGFVAVTVIGGSPLLPNSVYSRRNSYHPRYGHAPPRGRREIEPAADRALPDPAEIVLALVVDVVRRDTRAVADPRPADQFRRPRHGAGDHHRSSDFP